MLLVDLLYFDGCPSWQNGLANLEAALKAEGFRYQIHLVKIETSQQAQKEHFLGSPSFRVEGVDLWPEEREVYSLSCRVYHTPEGMKGFPSVEMLRKRLREILSARQTL